jgi:PPOX class probable F420-dependent enzyme
VGPFGLLGRAYVLLVLGQRHIKEDAMITVTKVQQQQQSAFASITGKYLSITSYRRDGTGVATPVWFVADGERLLVETDAASYKVKRIRRDPHVSVAMCSARGKTMSDPVEAHAEILPWDVERIEPMFEDKYRKDLVFFRPLRAVQKALHIGRRQDEPILLEITPNPET